MRFGLLTIWLLFLLALPLSAKKERKPGYEPLFGKAQAAYKVTSSSLKGATFYLVSGHGGPDVSENIRAMSCMKTNMPMTSFFVWDGN